MDADDSDGFVDEGFADAEVVCAAESAPVGCERTLALAAWKGKLPDVQYLLRQKADPNALANSAEDSYTPLIAAAANGNVAVVETLLLAGADPGLLAPSKVSASDLATNPTVARLLAVFGAEVEVELKKASALVQDAKEARRSALRAVRRRGKALAERVLGRSALKCQLAQEGDEAATGEEARRLRKQRREQEEAARQKRLAERAAERRGQTEEEREAARLQRVAARAAARRGLSDEDLRLQRVQQKAAARRRSRQDLPSSPVEAEAEAPPPLAITANGEEEVEEMDQAEKSRRRREVDPPPVVKKCVELQAINCVGCGVSGQPRRCGLCGGMGVCGFCSTCGLCGQASGFHRAPSVHMVPGLNTTSGDPRLSGLQAPEKEGRKKKRRKRSSKSGSSSSAPRDSADAPGSEGCSGEESGDEEAGVGGARKRTRGSRSRSPAAGRAGGNEEEFLADNRELRAKSQGLAYRFSRDLKDTVYDDRTFAAWGKFVTGVDAGDGWLKVGNLYLPMVLNGKRVLIPKAEAPSPVSQPGTPP